MAMSEAPRENPEWIQAKVGSDNHFNVFMVQRDPETDEKISRRPIEMPDLSLVQEWPEAPLVEGTYMWKKGGIRHKWMRRYFEVKQNIIYYFSESTDKKPLGVIPLEGCEIKVPPKGAQFFEGHSEVGAEVFLCGIARHQPQSKNNSFFPPAF